MCYSSKIKRHVKYVHNLFPESIQYVLGFIFAHVCWCSRNVTFQTVNSHLSMAIAPQPSCTSPNLWFFLVLLLWAQRTPLHKSPSSFIHQLLWALQKERPWCTHMDRVTPVRWLVCVMCLCEECISHRPGNGRPAGENGTPVWRR